MLSAFTFHSNREREEMLESAAYTELLVREKVRVMCVYARTWQRRALEASRLNMRRLARKCRESRDLWIERARAARGSN